MVSFNSIPADWMLPLTWIEVDPSQAGAPTSNKYALLSDYKIAAGTANADEPVAVGSVADAKAKFGAGSPLARMFDKFFAINKGSPILCLPVTPPSGGVAATADLVVLTAATAAGVLALYIAGQKVSVGIASGDTAAQAAVKINTAINAATDLPVTSTVATATVSITAKWKGVTGNDIRVELNVLGANGAEATPAGLTFTMPASNVLATGAGVPDWTNGIAALGDEPYEYVGMGHTDSGSLLAWGTEYGFTDSGRWGWLRESYGHVFTAKRDTYSNLFSYGTSNNSGVISIFPIEVRMPSPIWEVAAAYTARASRALTNDPARPLQTLTLDGISPAPKGYRFSKTEANALAKVGLVAQLTGADNVPVIMREQTTYQKNSLGQSDNAYQLVTTLATLAEVLRRLKSSVNGKYPRHKLANDGTRFGPGQAMLTPNTIWGELVSEYRAMEYDGLVENADDFKRALIVVRDPNNADRVNVLYPPDLVNGLRIFAVLAQFRLQYPTAAVA
jgi:phage tail sheath gpL-like